MGRALKWKWNETETENYSHGMHKSTRVQECAERSDATCGGDGDTCRVTWHNHRDACTAQYSTVHSTVHSTIYITGSTFPPSRLLVPGPWQPQPSPAPIPQWGVSWISDFQHQPPPSWHHTQCTAPHSCRDGTRKMTNVFVLWRGWESGWENAKGVK